MTSEESTRYPFPERAAAKSSTNILCKHGEMVACRKCGCRTKLDGTVLRPFAEKRPACACSCHAKA